MSDPSNGHAGADPSNGQRCQARRTDGSPCGAWAMRGQTVCRVHGGAAPQARRSAAGRLERQAAEAEWARAYGTLVAAADTDVDPALIVLGEIRWTAAHVEWLRAKVAELDPAALVWGPVSGGTRYVDGKKTVEARQEARPNAWLVLYQQERDRLTHQCEVAHRMGIEARLVGLAEQLGAAVAGAFRGLLADLQLTDQQQVLAAAAVPRHLRSVAGALGGAS